MTDEQILSEAIPSEGSDLRRRRGGLALVLIFVGFLISLFGIIIWSAGLGGSGAGKSIGLVKTSDLTVLYKWIQWVPDTEGCWGSAGKAKDLCPPRALVRYIVKHGKPCPTLFYDRGSKPVSGTVRRANPTPEEFPVDVCEALLPNSSAESIRFPDGTALAVPKLSKHHPPKRIVVMGDTGCRGRDSFKEENNQPCGDYSKWPFRHIADWSLRAKPDAPIDLVLHVGDYVYGEFHGRDHWEYWKKEFFEPAKDLLAAAPWVFVRGNHEICKRNSAYGWFLFLDYPESSGTRKCYPDNFAIYTPPYALDLATYLRVIVMDTATAFPKATDETRKEYERQFTRDLAALTNADKINKNVWILSHVPFRGLEKVEKRKNEFESPMSDASSFLWYYVTKYPLNDKVKVVISGDRHGFQWIAANGGVPIQLTIGNSGVKLDPNPTAENPIHFQPSSWNPGKEEIWSWENVEKFGFAIATSKDQGKSWMFQVWTAVDSSNDRYRHEYDCALTQPPTGPCTKVSGK